MLIDRWMDKEGMVHIYNGILLSHKKKWNKAICSNMCTTRGYHINWNKSEKDKYHMVYLYIDSKIWHKWTWLQNRSRLTDIETGLWLPGEGGGGNLVDWLPGEGRGGNVVDWEFGLGRCKPLHLEWMNNRVLIYSTRNYSLFCDKQ